MGEIVEIGIKKKEIIMSVILVFLILLFIFIIIFVYTNKNSFDVQEEVVVIDENTYVKMYDVNTDNYLDLYSSVNLKKVGFTNISENVVSEFYEKQESILIAISENISANSEYIENYNKDNNILDYKNNSKIDFVSVYELKDNILSLLYLVEDNVDYIGLNNYILNIFIDVNSNTLLDNNFILSKFNIDKKEVSSKILDRVINEHDNKFIDKDTLEEIKKEDILLEREEYLALLEDNFDNYIYPYLNGDNLYFKFNKSDISNFLFNEDLDIIQYSTMKW